MDDVERKVLDAARTYAEQHRCIQKMDLKLRHMEEALEHYQTLEHRQTQDKSDDLLKTNYDELVLRYQQAGGNLRILGRELIESCLELSS